MTRPPVEQEREGCALLADELAVRWEASAAKLRKRTTRFFFFGPRYALPEAERDAKNIDAAAHGLRAVARLIREGYAAQALKGNREGVAL